MPRQVLEFRIIVASPSELYDSRKAVFEVIQELNRTLEVHRASIKGLGWEEYATPGIGSEVQEVVGEQILREYDILVALFATRLGTPTDNHVSGTVEEIENAIADVNNPMGKHRVQIYFRDRIESASSISMDEFAKLTEFRKELEPRGVLYRLFKDDNELRKEIQVNILRPILEYLKSSQSNSHLPPQPTPAIAGRPSVLEPLTRAESEPEEYGILDLAEKAEKAIELSGSSIVRINELIEEIGAETNRQVEEIETRLMQNASTAEKKTFINNFAAFLKSKASALEQESKIARSNFSIFASSIVIVADLQKKNQGNEKYKDELAAFLSVAETMLTTLVGTRGSVATFRNAVVNIPQITAQFNQAKKLLIEAIDECLAFFDEVERGIFEITAKT